MTKLTILCDADDTIADLSAPWLEALNQTYHKHVRKEDMTCWDITAAFPDLSPEEIFAPIYDKSFWNRLTPIEGSAYYLKKLQNDGHDLYIVTATNYETSDAKVAKLLELFPFLTSEQIIVAHNKHLISGDVLIDDGVHNLLKGTYAKLLFHQPNNASFNEKEHGITRIFSWQEAYEKICLLAA